MKHWILICCIMLSMHALAEEVTFDFHNPASLTPSVNEPGLKSGIELGGMTFTSGTVTVSFTQNETGNTKVRLYHSYDAGVDLRLYDGDVMTISVSGDQYISQIRFTMSLSGAASGTNDINFIPSTGEFVWEEEAWSPDAGTKPRSVELTSAEQSRIYTMTVTLEEISALDRMTKVDGTSVSYYSILGHQLPCKPSRRGVYIEVSGGVSRKIILR